MSKVIKEKIIKYLKKYFKAIMALICIILLIYIVRGVFKYEIMSLDINGYNLIKIFINPKVTIFMKIVTNFGGRFFLVFLALVLFSIFINKKQMIMGMAVSINLVIIASLNFILKNIIQRPRPYGYRLIDEKGYSFPSGHSMVSMAFYGFIIYLIYKNVKNEFLRNIIIVLLSCLIILIGISRIYLGVHYTSDVIAGFVISICYLIVFIEIYKNIVEDEDLKD